MKGIMKREIKKEEWWPVFEIAAAAGSPIDIPDNLVEEYERNIKEFDRIQAVLKGLYGD